MRRARGGLLLAGLFVCLPVQRVAGADDWQRGVCFAHTVLAKRGYGSPACHQSLERLRELHVNWISLTPFGFARSDTEPSIHMIHEAGTRYQEVGETDERVIAAVQHAHELGLRVMLKPHVWITPRGGSWRGSIHFEREEDWDLWFAAYERFIVHYARLAAAQKVDALCVGTELASTTAAHPDRWRAVIAKIRAEYDGPLTYAAHYDGEAAAISFWDALNYIGINAYFPLDAAEGADISELERAWSPIVQELAALAGRWQRPILFTEIGYRSARDAVRRPGLWTSDAAPSAMTQARAYEATFRSVMNQPWFAGMYWWKWESDDEHAGGLTDTNFTPQHKPASFVLRSYYERAATRRPAVGSAEGQPGAD